MRYLFLNMVSGTIGWLPFFETPGGNSGWELRDRGDLARHDFRAELRAAVRAPWRLEEEKLMQPGSPCETVGLVRDHGG